MIRICVLNYPAGHSVILLPYNPIEKVKSIDGCR